MKSLRFALPALALALAAASGGCRSSARNSARVQPAPTPPAYAYPAYPSPTPPVEAYAPPAPPPVADPSVEEMQAQALEAERQARILAEERARRAEEMLHEMATPPAAPPGGGWAPPGGESAATAFAEDLRAACDAEVVQTGDTVMVRMSDAFKAGSDQLKGDVKHVTTLHAVADALMRHPEGSVAVVGHTDGTPIKKTKDKWSDNAHLSRARAETIARLLEEKGAGRVAVDGRGEVEPLVYPERTSGDRARNRRVEILVRF